MIIQLGKFELEPSAGCTDRWDMKECVTRTKKNSTAKYSASKTIAFSINLEYALETMIAMHLAEDNEKVTLQEYLEAYKVEKNKLLKTITQITKFETIKQKRL
jgi:hypothetical protein